MTLVASATVAAVAAVACAAPPPTPRPTVQATMPVVTEATRDVEVDRSLLELLPERVDGVPVEFQADASRAAARRVGPGGPVASVAYAVAGGIPLTDLAIVTVAGLVAGGVDEAGYRGLRDEFNEEVCRQWGGVAGNAQAEVGGRTVHIGTCEREGRTYHALLPGSNAVVSVYSAGDKRLGELLMRELRDQ